MFFLIKFLIKYKIFIMEDKRIYFINFRYVFVFINDIFYSFSIFYL